MKRAIYYLAAAVMLSWGCTAEQSGNHTETTLGKVPMTFEANFSCSRTTLSDTNDVLWSESDAISLFGTADTDNNSFALSSGSGTQSATFSGAMTAGSTSYWAVYPYSASNSFDASTQTLTIALPQNQDYSTDSFSTMTNPMAATSTGSTLAFKNLCGILRLPLTGNSTISQIIVYDASGMPLAGSATVTFVDGTPTVTMTETNSLPVVIDCGTSGVTLTSTATTFYAVVPPRSFDSGFQVVIIDTDNNAMVSNIAFTSVSRAGVRTLSAIDYTLEEVTYYGTSNCHQYVTSSSPQAQSIDVSPYRTTAYALYTNTAADNSLSADTAAIIWQDNASLLTGVTMSSNTLSFTVGASQTGNALIGIYQSSTVVWSFHIWVTSTTVANDAYSNGYTLMDRNLGATNATGSPGLFYQWGRKEPFRNTTNTTVAGPQTVAYSVANPTTFITANGVGSWYDDDYISLWGNPFGYTALPEQVYTGKKTVFDPCPDGYQVAAPVVFTSFSSSNFTWSSNGSSSSLTTGGGWYPAAGFLTSSSGSISINSSAGYYWTNSPFDYYDYSGSLSYVGSCALIFSSTHVTPNDWVPAASAASVRCMQTN